jgi:hypothetical protein
MTTVGDEGADGKGHKRVTFGPVLRKLYMIDTTIPTREETGHERILFYHPDSTPLQDQIKDSGLAEALVNFSQTFAGAKPCETVRLKKHTVVFLQPEPAIWMVMSVDNPSVQVPGGRQAWAEEDLEPEVLRFALRRTYRIFRLFYGTLRSVMDRHGIDHLRMLLRDFLLATMVRYPPGQFNMIDAIDGIKFLPLDSLTFLSIQSAVNMTENNFPPVTSTMFLYKDQLVWSGFEQAISRLLYSHFAPLFPMVPAGTPAPAPSTPPVASANSSLSASGLASLLLAKAPLAPPTPPPVDLEVSDFFTLSELAHLFNLNLLELQQSTLNRPADPPAATDADPSPPPPPQEAGPSTALAPGSFTIPIHLGDPPTPAWLAVYRHGNVMVLLLMPALPTGDFFERLRSHLRRRLPPLAESLDVIMERRTATSSIEEAFRFVYYNSMNLALKSSLPTAQLSRDILRALNHMHHDFATTAQDGPTERVVQTRKHQWIVGRCSDQRSLYLIIDGPAESVFNLAQVDDHLQRLTSTVFGNIWW